MVGLNTNIQIITLDTNGQNTLTKRQRLVEWIEHNTNKNPTYMMSTRILF